MKKLSTILAISMVLALLLSACGPKAPVPTTPPTDAPTEPAPVNTGVEPGTVYNCVADFNFEEGQSGVWQYYFSGDSGKTYDPCGTFNDYGGGISGWHPWEGSYTGVGFNGDVEGFLELNTDCYSEDYSGQMGTLAFEAPADGKYVLTAAVWNPWEQSCGVFTFQKDDGSVIYEQDMTDKVAIYGYITPTDVELKAGEKIYMFCNATGSEWVSAYINATIYYEPTDDSCYEVPVVEAPVVEPEIVPDVEGAWQSAAAEFTSESADGLWVYASTFDGKEYTVMESYDAPDWDGDGEADANQWYSANGTGLGFNFDAGMDWIEANVSESAENGGEMTALGFKAPEAGTYKLTVFTQNKWGQDADSVVVSVNGEDVQTIDFLESVTVCEVEVTLEAGQIVYFHGTSNGGWVSAYIAVFVY